jgi:alkanesulfonate monooxygenase SsuD/methylene tetrahydromethanopterin reductase-like flavin-dependent oxidoreductase (luciferase family)
MLLSAKIAPTFDYPVLRDFWLAVDDLGFHFVATYDHFYGLIDHTVPTFEGWTTLPPWRRSCSERG